MTQEIHAAKIDGISFIYLISIFLIQKNSFFKHSPCLKSSISLLLNQHGTIITTEFILLPKMIGETKWNWSGLANNPIRAEMEPLCMGKLFLCKWSVWIPQGSCLDLLLLRVGILLRHFRIISSVESNSGPCSKLLLLGMNPELRITKQRWIPLRY